MALNNGSDKARGRKRNIRALFIQNSLPVLLLIGLVALISYFLLLL